MRLDNLLTSSEGGHDRSASIDSAATARFDRVRARQGPAVSPTNVRHCRRCRAVLRRTNEGDLCAPCARVAAAAAPSLPADFYSKPDVVAALRNRNFGPFFRIA